MRFFYFWLLLLASATQAREFRDFKSPSCGATLIEIPSKPVPLLGVTDYKWPTRKGALVGAVWHNGPAQKANLPIGSVVFQIDKTKVASVEPATEAIRSHNPGDSFRIVYYEPTKIKNKIRFKRKAAKVTLGTYWDIICSQMQGKSDELNQTMTYRHIESPEGRSQNFVSLRVVMKGDSFTPVLRTMYRANTWLFVRQYAFLVDGKKHELNPGFSAFFRDNAGGYCWEWTELPADPSNEKDPVWNAIQDLAYCSKAKVFYKSEKFRDEHELTFDELLGLQAAAEFYRGLESGLRP